LHIATRAVRSFHPPPLVFVARRSGFHPAFSHSRIRAGSSRNLLWRREKCSSVCAAAAAASWHSPNLAKANFLTSPVKTSVRLRFANAFSSARASRSLASAACAWVALAGRRNKARAPEKQTPNTDPRTEGTTTTAKPMTTGDNAQMTAGTGAFQSRRTEIRNNTALAPRPAEAPPAPPPPSAPRERDPGLATHTADARHQANTRKPLRPFHRPRQGPRATSTQVRRAHLRKAGKA